MSRGESGQSTVEFALCLPLVALAVALVAQVGLIASANVRLWHAAREAARVAAVDGDLQTIRAAADRSGLVRIAIEVEPAVHDRTQGGPVTVRVEHPVPQIALIGRLWDGTILHAAATTRVESP